MFDIPQKEKATHRNNTMVCPFIPNTHSHQMHLIPDRNKNYNIYIIVFHIKVSLITHNPISFQSIPIEQLLEQ